MILYHVADILTYAEPILWMGILFAFLKSEHRKFFPALCFYLLLQAICSPFLTFLLHARHIFPAYEQAFYFCYFFLYWAAYLGGVVAIFFVIQDLFRYALAPLPGLSRLGIIAFRWAGLVSLIIALVSTASTVPLHAGFQWFMVGSYQIMRCVAVLQLCLLAFLALSVHALGLSFRSRAFGISLALGIMATTDFLTAVFIKLNTNNMAQWVNTVGEVVLAGALITWLVYMAVPEPARKPVMVPATSALVRWNEIAVALGHGTPQVALAPAGQFFLQDVEKVVDKILAKNSLNIAS